MNLFPSGPHWSILLLSGDGQHLPAPVSYTLPGTEVYRWFDAMLWQRLSSLLIRGASACWHLKGEGQCVCMCDICVSVSLVAKWVTKCKQCGSWAPRTLGPWSFHAPQIRRYRWDVWPEVFSTLGGFGWPGSPGSISVCFWLLGGVIAASHPHFMSKTQTYSIFLSHTRTHRYTHTTRRSLIYVPVRFLIFALQVLNVCFLLTDVAVGDTLCISIYCAPPPFLLSVLP